MNVELWLEPRSYDAPSDVIRDLSVAFACRGVVLRLRCPERELVALDRLPVDADLYLVKSDTELALSLAEVLEAKGAHVVNATAAMRLAKEKAAAAAILQDAGIPAPRAFLAERVSSLAEAWRPLVIKPERGYHGAGVRTVLRARGLPDDEGYPEVVFAQERIRHDDEVKIVGVGQTVRALHKPYAPGSYATAGTEVAIDTELASLGLRAARAFGLDLWGIDVVYGYDGPRVVDVNSFPGYRGLAGAADLIADWVVGEVAA